MLADNTIRYGFFSKAVLSTLPHLFWTPHIFLCNGWQNAMLPGLYKEHFEGSNKFYKKIKTILLIHENDEFSQVERSDLDLMKIPIDPSLKGNKLNAYEVAAFNANAIVIFNRPSSKISTKLMKLPGLTKTKKIISVLDLKDDDKLGNVSEFLNYIAEFELSSDTNDISDFLNSLMLSSSTDEMIDSSSFVTLMTVHLSKGLEFPCVYVVGIEEGLFPHSRSMYSTSEIEEERRLCYVAFTRAISSLNLSYCKMRRMFGSITYASMSQFLDEIIECDDLEEINAMFESTSNERVFHYKFGNGFIDTNDNDNFEDVVTVVFESGVKKKVFVSDLEEAE